MNKLLICFLVGASLVSCQSTQFIPGQNRQELSNYSSIGKMHSLAPMGTVRDPETPRLILHDRGKETVTIYDYQYPINPMLVPDSLKKNPVTVAYIQ